MEEYRDNHFHLTLKDAYPTAQAFASFMEGAWTHFNVLNPDAHLSIGEKLAISTAIYDWYRDTLLFSEQADFEEEMPVYLAKGALSAIARLRKYSSILKNLDELLVKGGFLSTRTSQIDRTDTDTRSTTRSGSLESQSDGGNTAFTKQADTPTAVNPSSDFVDQYTDYQSKTVNDTDLKTETTYKDLKEQRSGGVTIDDDETHITDLKRTGSNADAVSLLRSIPTNVYEPIYDCIAPLFVSIYYL